MNNPEIIVKNAPFKHFCMSIGAIPTSYLDTLDYYETLLYLIKYLEETVIPVVNNNGEAVSELQSLYIQLKDYVENYFANLDVQKEINNKLDEMALNGTLTNILNNQNIKNSLVCSVEYRDVEEYIDGVTNNEFNKGYLQGFTTTNNSYILCIRENTNINPTTNTVLIQEISKSTKQLIREQLLNLGHANSIAYNEDNNKLYVAVSSYFVNDVLTADNRIIEIDYSTLNITNEFNFEESVKSVSYDKISKNYLIGSGINYYLTKDLINLDKEITLNISNSAPNENDVLNRTTTIQNAIIFNNKIYLVRYFANGINVFDINGNLLQNYYSFDIDAPVKIQELESISVEENGDIYIASMQTCDSDYHKYYLYDKMIVKSNLIYNGYKKYDYINNTTSKIIFYVDKDSTNYIQIGTETKPFKTIQQAIMATEFIQKDLGVVINCVGSNKNYGFIVAKSTKNFTLNGNNNVLYGMQLQNQDCTINYIKFNLDVDVSLISETIKSNIKILFANNVILKDCQFINSVETKKDNGIYANDSKLQLYTASFNNFINGIYLYNSELYIKDGITATNVDNYFFPKGSTQIFQNSGAVLNRCNPDASIAPLVFATSQSIRLKEGSQHLIEFDNKNIETSSTGRNQFLVEFSITMNNATFSSKFTLFKTEYNSFTFINQAKTKMYNVALSLTHTTNSGIWDINALRVLETDISTGTISEVSNPTITINAVRTIY